MDFAVMRTLRQMFNSTFFPDRAVKRTKGLTKEGLFKLEFEGEEMISLCSKTYIVKKTLTRDPRRQLLAEKLLRKTKKLK